MTMPPPEELDAQTPDKHGVVRNQLFTSSLRHCGGWFANHELRRTRRGRRGSKRGVPCAWSLTSSR